MISGRFTYSFKKDNVFGRETLKSVSTRGLAECFGRLLVVMGALAVALHGFLGVNLSSAIYVCTASGTLGGIVLVSSLLIKYVKTSILNLCPGSQLECNGSVEVRRCKSILKSLNESAPPGIIFDETQISNFIHGGTCTAMALNFLNCYFQAACPTDIESFYRYFQYFFNFSSQEMRNVQAALNSITVSDKNVDDIEKNKVQAYLNYHKIGVSEASSVIDLNAIKPTTIMFLSLLSDGIYFVRSLKPQENQKGELRGDSMILVKAGSQFYVYEPNGGLYKTQSAAALLDFFQFQHHQFDIPRLRLYRCTQ